MGDLALVARSVVDGYMFGLHPSRMPGAGLEFSQYRSYQAGDDLRRVDWKLYGRSDRYFVRDAEIETSLTVRLVVDASASMAHASGLSKFDYARFLAASIAMLCHRQGDATGLFAVAEGRLDATRPGRGQTHLHRIIHQLEGFEPAGVWPAWAELEGAITAGGERGLVIIITDLHERGDEIRSAVLRLAAMRHEVVVFHLTAPEELDLSYGGPIELEEIETGRVVEVDPALERAAYGAAVEADHRRYRRELQDRGVDYTRLTITEPLDAALRAFLVARGRSPGGR